ncbi:MAG: hypothetical protein K2K58_04470 [Muribaculaceae bacterium]|nr:hypothetical protein [Muribaculaceae bacterium]
MANINERPLASMSGLIFLITSVVLFLGAIGIFIWLIVDAAEENLVKNILYGAAFLVCTLGLLIYVLCVNKAPRLSASILWAAMILGAASFIVGLCLKTNRDITQASIPQQTPTIAWQSLK